MTGTNGYIGKQIGNYKIIKKLGEGGFAEVYLGEHIHLKTLAAIKLLLDKADTEGEQVAFLKEAQIIAHLTHPHIVRILDFGIDGKMPFLIMEYAPAGTLRQRHSRGTRLPVGSIVDYVNQVANALQHAHDNKYIHRDVKPENMLLNARNEVLLSDFGIAAVAHSSRSINMNEQNPAGTPTYMAPEQSMGMACPASDQYALGVVVYEWLCGQPPFVGSLFVLLQQHQNSAPQALHERVSAIPLSVEHVVLKALAKEPRERHANLTAFAQALEQAVRFPQQSVQISIPRSQSGPPVVPPPQWLKPVMQQPAPSGSFEQLWVEVTQAQVQGDSERAFRLLLAILRMKNVTASQRELVKSEIQSSRQMIPWCILQARKASSQADWQTEVQLWEDSLELDSAASSRTSSRTSPRAKDTEQLTLSPTWSRKDALRERLRIAQHNQQYAWMYDQAQRFINQQNNAAARKQLETLWRQAPYYGDPAGLAHKVGLSAADNYEQALTKELTLQQQREEEARRKREEEEARQKREKRKLEQNEKRKAIAAEVSAGIGVGCLSGILLAPLLWAWNTYTPAQTQHYTTISSYVSGLERALSAFARFPQWATGAIEGAVLGLIVGFLVGYVASLFDSSYYVFGGRMSGRIVGFIAGATLFGIVGGILAGDVGSLIGLGIGAWIGMASGAGIGEAIGEWWR